MQSRCPHIPFAHASLTLQQSRHATAEPQEGSRSPGGDTFKGYLGKQSRGCHHARKKGSPLKGRGMDARTRPFCALPASSHTPSLVVVGPRGNRQVEWRTVVTLTQPPVEERAQLLGSLSGNVRKIMGISQSRWSSAQPRVSR